jgi:FHA domain
VAQFVLLQHHSRSEVNEIRPAGKLASPMRLLLKEVDGPLMVSVQLIDRLIIGRGDEEREPDIDLTQLDGVEQGISRWHAEFTYRDTQLFVEDLNSTNGTRLNGFRLDVGRRYRLRNGDELELGHLRLIVQVVRPPG